MIARRHLFSALALVLMGVATRVDAFTVAHPISIRSATFLRAEESEEGQSTEDNAPSGGGGGEGSSDILSSPAFLKRKIDVLKSDIDEAEGQIAELKAIVDEGKAEWEDQLDKLRTEYSNIQERLGNQTKKGDTMATVQVARAMLDVLDNFDRAFGSVTAETEEEQTIENEYRATYDQILETFKELGVTTVETVGTEFDYEYHQAVMQMPSDEYEEGIVCKELQKGFVIGETLIRAAMVCVAA